MNLVDTDFSSLLPLADKNTKLAKNKEDEKVLFNLFPLGVYTNSNEWLIDLSSDVLKEKAEFFTNLYSWQQSQTQK